MIYYDLQIEAKEGHLGDVWMRENELRRIARSLKRQYNNNVLIHGPSGVGKTALIEGFCYRVCKNSLTGFSKYSFVKLDTPELKKIIGNPTSESVTQIQQAFKQIPGNTAVVIDDFQLLISEQKMFEVSQVFEQFFERTDIMLIIILSEEAYQSLTEHHLQFVKNFEDVLISEPDSIETEQILIKLSPAFAKEYGITIEPGTLHEVVHLSAKMNSDKKFPLRAMHLLDESLAHASINNETILTTRSVKEIYSEKTGVPETQLTAHDTDQLIDLPKILKKGVFGQDYAIDLISDTVRRSRMGLRNPHRPNGSFLFLGPSGVGKTELSKLLANTVYGSERAFTRIDMSEFSEAHTVQRLIGAPPGYIGYESGGQLTNAVKNQPYSLVLLDEIEKANPRIFDIFLQVFEDGRLSDGRGQLVDFTNTIIVATSNLGIQEIVDSYSQGTDIQSTTFIETSLLPILTRNFRLEFLNRFDSIIVFNPLSIESLLDVAMLEINKIEERTAEHHITFSIDREMLRDTVTGLIDYRFGARPVKRFIEQTCENLIALKLMEAKK